jgi:hypothetical protein
MPMAKALPVCVIIRQKRMAPAGSSGIDSAPPTPRGVSYYQVRYLRYLQLLQY